ncbi:MAG TPA: MATE family efflux transporter [Petrotogaceae bacterium]|jgi:putative MATE family efflux protein|nr:MATE family efflux transporter [Petrotogaceae bacterium]
MSIKEQLLSNKPKDLMFQMSVPAVIGMVVIGLYPLMDGIFAGNIIGERAMSAISIASPLTLLNNGVATLIGIGSASILLRAMGKNDQNTVDKIMGNLIAWITIFSIAITVFVLVFAETFLKIVGATPEIAEMGLRYLKVTILGSLFVNFTQSANMVMRGEGLMKKAMIIMGLGAAINIILDPILMTVMGEKAIEGAALATVSAQILQAIATIYYFIKKSPRVRIHRIKTEKSISKEMFSVGSSAMLMQLLFMLQQTMLYKMAFKYGGESNGILMAASLRFYGFSFIPLWGMSQGLQPIIGTNFGAKKYLRVKETMKVFMIGGACLAAIFWIPAQLFPNIVLRIFNVSQSIINEGIFNFRLFYSVFILYGIMVMSITFFQSIGDGKKAGIIVLFRQLILFVPCMLVLPNMFGISAVWFTQPLVDLIMILIGLQMQMKTLKKMVAYN